MAEKQPGYVYILTNPSFREDWIKIGKTTNKRLSLAHLIDRGLKGAPMGAINLSKKEMKELLKYIEENF